MKKIVSFFTLLFYLSTSILAQNDRGMKATSTTNNASNSSGEKRIALVIGNADYSNGSNLENPVNDATLMANTLNDLGFEVIFKTNMSLRQMQMAEAEFTSKLSEYDVSLFYYAGHGIQVDGTNYLLPTDVKLDNKNMIKYEGFDIQNINNSFAKNQSSTNIMILDACRNNPFKSFSRGGERGFKKVEN